MNNLIKNLLIRLPIYDVLRSLKHRREMRDWEKGGRPDPLPDILKHKILKNYGQQFKLKTFVETGTYLGDTVVALKDSFEEIFSVELDSFLYKRAKQKFLRYPHIHIIHGDSGDVLPQILASLNKTDHVLFWLDAHYCGGITAKAKSETPSIRELECILSYSVTQHVILIDDARCYTGRNGYPTLDELLAFVSQKCPNLAVGVENDIIRIYPRT